MQVASPVERGFRFCRLILLVFFRKEIRVILICRKAMMLLQSPHHMIQFNVPATTGNEEKYIRQVLKSGKFSGDGSFTKKCQKQLEKTTGAKKVLLTTSGTHALDMAALLSEIKKGDEVIMSSYTFSSTANAFALQGAKLVFVDIRPDTMNIDEHLIKKAITPKTRVIVVMHYGGIACEMDTIMAIAKKHRLLVIEDAAHAISAKYKNRALGTIGNIGCFSFHETKNLNSGEGGAILLNDSKLIERAEIVREKGTNRSKFYRGEVAKYSWVDIGSSYLPSEINAAFLWAQLEKAGKINLNRLKSWNCYYKKLLPLAKKGLITLPTVPKNCRHNAHVFYLKTKNLSERTALIKYLKENGIMSVFHYVPLHSSKAGKKFGRFNGEDVWTTKESDKLLRLPMYYKLKKTDIEKIIEKVSDFYNMKK